MKTVRMACLLLALLLPITALAAMPEGMPDWTYPIPADILSDRDGFLTLTNRASPLPSSFAPGDLVAVTMRHVSGGFQLRKAVNDALQAMFDDAESAGHKLYVKSAYRSYQTQNTMYYTRLERYGRDDGLVAYPGSSDHQTGLGVDVLNHEWANRDGMNENFAKTKESQWMAAHCHEYGFVIRYMQGKEDITGIKFEPWHLRYVGRECAAYIMENALSLEEFDAQWRQYVSDFEAAGGDFAAYCAYLAALPPPLGAGEYDHMGDEEVLLFYDSN